MGNIHASNRRFQKQFQSNLARAKEEYPNGMATCPPDDLSSESVGFTILTSNSCPIKPDLEVAMGNYAQCYVAFHRSDVREPDACHQAHDLVRRALRRLNLAISAQNQRVEASGEEATVHLLTSLPNHFWVRP